MRFDPDDYYRCLGVQPEASGADIIAAFRGKARVLHPDVPTTGDEAAFVALRQAYDVLSNRDRRAVYDRKARDLAQAAIKPDAAVVRPTSYASADPPSGQRGGQRDGQRDEQRDEQPGGQHHPSVDPAERAGWSTATADAWVDGSAADAAGRQGGLSIIAAGCEAWFRQFLAFDVPIWVWAGLGAFLCLSVYQAAVHLLTPPRQAAQADIRPNAAVVAPLSPRAHEAVLYGPSPVRLAGVPNFYVNSGAGPAVLWVLDKQRNILVPLGKLPPFSMVQAVRLIRQNGLVEVLVNDHGNGLISASRLTPGDTAAAHRAYCGYNAGPTPKDGELLARHGSGTGRLELENRALQPAVVKLRDATGAVVIAVFLGPQGHATFNVVPSGTYHPEFAIGELWSRACNSFAAGMRAWRLHGALRSPAESRLVVEPDAGAQAAATIPDQAFERN